MRPDQTLIFAAFAAWFRTAARSSLSLTQPTSGEVVRREGKPLAVVLRAGDAVVVSYKARKPVGALVQYRRTPRWLQS